MEKLKYFKDSYDNPIEIIEERVSEIYAIIDELNDRIRWADSEAEKYLYEDIIDVLHEREKAYGVMVDELKNK
mgnify:CR=1 FL=1